MRQQLDLYLNIDDFARFELQLHVEYAELVVLEFSRQIWVDYPQAVELLL
jgi:hypothetical protein